MNDQAENTTTSTNDVSKPPADAIWFGLEVLVDADSDQWIMVQSDEFGGPWWRLGVADPQELAAKAAGDTAAIFRAVWTPKDRRHRLGRSRPFRVGADQGQVEKPPTTPEQVSTDPAAPAAATVPPSPSFKAAATPQVSPRVNGGNGHKSSAYKNVRPKIPLEFTPPPTASEQLITFTYLYQLAQQSADRGMAMMMTMHEASIANERTRSREAIQSMQLHYQAVERGQRELQAALLSANKGGETAPQVVQLLAAQSGAIQELAEKIEEIDAADTEAFEQQMLRLSENPNNLERTMAGLQGIMSVLANSPLAEPLARMLTGGANGSTAAAGEPVDFPEGPPPQ